MQVQSYTESIPDLTTKSLRAKYNTEQIENVSQPRILKSQEKDKMHKGQGEDEERLTRTEFPSFFLNIFFFKSDNIG